MNLVELQDKGVELYLVEDDSIRYRGPEAVLTPTYLEEIPLVDIRHHHSSRLNTVQDRFNDRGDWMYSMLNGFVAVNCTHDDTKGIPISNW